MITLLVLIAPLPVLFAIFWLLAVTTPVLSRRRNAKHAARTGASWAGYALMNAIDADQAPAVTAALADVGPPFGTRWGGSDTGSRPVGGRLSLFPDRLAWEPGTPLYHGRAHPWQVPLGAVAAARITKMPWPAIRSYRTLIETRDGPINVVFLDTDGFERALRTSAPHVEVVR